MEEGKPSATALLSAMARAAHLLWGQPPKIFRDTLALRLSGCQSEAALKAQMEQFDAELARTTNPDFALTLRRLATAAASCGAATSRTRLTRRLDGVFPST
jgi:hypothetical protein